MSDKVILHVHSVVDRITNSSTEIYTNLSSNAKETATKFLKSMLTSVGYKGPFDDMFTVEKQENTIIISSKLTGQKIDLVGELMGIIDQYAEYNG
jgi:hypothetical protein